MIDCHCHIDLYEKPFEIIKESEQAGIITIGMTNLPRHFEVGYPHVLPFKKIRLALGMHPLLAEQHAEEFSSFVKNLSKTSYIGEVGLDFSSEGIKTKDAQLISFQKILRELKGKKKILSLHSRRAEKEVLNFLVENNIENAIFHWYSGPLPLIETIAKLGYYFSVNPAMIKSAYGQKVIAKIPHGNMLTETDGPFILEQGKPIQPKDVFRVLDYLSKKWNLSQKETEKVVDSNFRKLIKAIS